MHSCRWRADQFVTISWSSAEPSEHMVGVSPRCYRRFYLCLWILRSRNLLCEWIYDCDVLYHSRVGSLSLLSLPFQNDNVLGFRFLSSRIRVVVWNITCVDRLRLLRGLWLVIDKAYRFNFEFQRGLSRHFKRVSTSTDLSFEIDQLSWIASGLHYRASSELLLDELS